MRKRLGKPFVHILFGARQTGKSTLLKALIPDPAIYLNLADPAERTRLLSSPDLFRQMCEALPAGRKGSVIVVDEAQNVPAVFDSVQTLYDRNRHRWRFILCGSSARKLRETGANLLPGRCFLYRLYPLMLCERPSGEPRHPENKPLFTFEKINMENPFPKADLLERISYGDLPGVTVAPEEDRADLLKAYTIVHLEEEIRREALVRDWGAFVNFLRLAAGESGQETNFAGISREIGLSLPTVKSYYQLLEDMFIGFRIHAFTGSCRKHLLSTPRFYFFDLGVRHAASGVNPGKDAALADPGRFFEQWVGIELWKRLQYLGKGQLYYYRTKDGAEIDFIVSFNKLLIPIEVKWSERPSLADARHLLSFLREHNDIAQGYVVCRCAHPFRLHERILAMPWHGL